MFLDSCSTCESSPFQGTTESILHADWVSLLWNVKCSKIRNNLNSFICHMQEIHMISHSKTMGALKVVYSFSTLGIKCLWTMIGIVFKLGSHPLTHLFLPNPWLEPLLSWSILDSGQSTTYPYSFLLNLPDYTGSTWGEDTAWTIPTSPAWFTIWIRKFYRTATLVQ